MKKNITAIIIVAGILIIVAAALYFILGNKTVVPVAIAPGPEVNQPAVKNYTWISEQNKIDLAKISWNKIEATRLAGFNYKTNVAELKNEACGGEGHYLRTEGGMLRTGYCFSFKDGAVTKIIDSVAKLKEVFAPVNKEAAAVSFVAVMASDYKIDGDVMQGYSATVDDGYLVRIIQQNTFGCGNHKPTEAIYKVSKAGDVQLLAQEVPSQGSSGAQVCVD
jgi:hypothetical protein